MPAASCAPLTNHLQTDTPSAVPRRQRKNPQKCESQRTVARRRMTEVAVRVGRQTKWISGLTEATTCKVRWEKHRLQTIYELDAARPEFARNRFSFTPAGAICKVYSTIFCFQINTSCFKNSHFGERAGAIELCWWGSEARESLALFSSFLAFTFFKYTNQPNTLW